MKHRRNAVLIGALVLSISLACSFSALSATSTPAPDYTATQQMQTSQAVAATAHSGAATAEREATSVAQVTANAEATAVAEAAQDVLDGTATKGAVFTQNADRKATKAAATAIVHVTATAQARVMADQVEQLQNDGVLISTKGTYYHLPDFDESWAQINWYKGWPQGLLLDRFVIRADSEWDSASTTANWFDSGCGFIYSANGNDDHYASFLAMDGYVHNYRYKNVVFTELNGGYYGQVNSPKGKARVMLAVDDGSLNFYVNGKKVVSVLDRSLGEGILALTIHSGTNKDFGTRCIMANIEVWSLE